MCIPMDPDGVQRQGILHATFLPTVYLALDHSQRYLRYAQACENNSVS